MLLWLHLDIVKMLLLIARVLLKKDKVRIRIPDLLKKITKYLSISQTHPVAAVLKYVTVLV